MESLISLDRNEYFYLPGKIVQFDSDKFYLDRCINFYKDMHLEAYGIKVKESEIEDVITDTLEKYKPDIVVITGHDFLKKHAKDKSKIENYQNSENFVNAIKKEKKVIGVPRLAKYEEHVDNHQMQLIKEFTEMNLIEACNDINDLEAKIKSIKNKNFTKYKSNNDKFLQNIKEYIEEK